MKKVWKRVVATALTVSLVSSFNISKITFAEEKSTNEIAIDANNFPDSIFQDYVKSNFDENKDGKLNDKEISNITYIYVNMKGIKDLKGIENFTNLECLYAEMNYIESLDLSKNKNLIVGYFNNNLIKSVKLPNNVSNDKLEVLSLFDNRLTEINLSNLDVLRYINLGDNRLKTLDLNVGKIESFTASYNELTEIKLPNSGATYEWKNLLRDQLYHERTGYNYKWYYDDNKTQEVDPNVTPSIKLQGQTLYSEYIPIKYTVEFKSGDSNSESKIQSFVYDTPQNLLKNEFTKEEHTFSGWKDNSNGKIYLDKAEVKNLTTKNGDKIILSATWTEKDYSNQKYKINLYNEESIVDTTEINYGTSFKPSTEKITKEGYTFLGWSIGNDEKVAYSNGEDIIMTTPSQLNGAEVDGVKSLNLYAVWKIKEFNVNFIDGENTYKKVVEYNKQVIAPVNPTKKGYIFEGWVNEKGEMWNKDSLVTSDMKLYAKYSPILYSISFEGNGANNSEIMNNKTLNMDYSKQAILPENLYEKTGYIFKGWSTSKNGEVEFVDKDVIYQLTSENNKNVTLYAIWEKVKFGSEIIITTTSLDKAYDGKAVENPNVEKTGSSNEVKFTWYQKIDSKWEEISDAPFSAGIYKVVASVAADEDYKDASVEKEFEITKAIPQYENIENFKVTYGDTLKNIKLPEGFNWQDDLSTSVGNVGENKFKVKYTPKDTKNYEIIENIEVTITVKKATNTWTVEPSIEGWILGEKPNNPIGQSIFGEVKFAYSNLENGTFTTELPTEVGTWYMKATVIGNKNYSGLEKVVSFIIEEVKNDNADKEDQETDGETIKPDDEIIKPDEEEKPSDDQKPDEEEKPSEEATPNEDAKPSEDNVITEVPTIKPNDENHIIVNTEEDIKNVEVIIKDIKAIKNGTGSLNISINNNIQMNLPLSLIDKNLLEGAKDVSVKIDVIEDLDIIKDLKAINKVFDFSLIINSESESTSIHNFKNGIAEITFSLSDKDFEGLNRDKLKVYYYNEETKKFEAMETKVEGNNITFKTSHFSKYIISEEILDKNVDESNPEDNNTSDKDEDITNKPNTDNSKPTSDKDEDVITKPDNNGEEINKPNTDTEVESEKNEEVTIKPDTDDNKVDNEENITEREEGNLPETGAVVSSTIIIVLAIGIIAIGGAMFVKKERKNRIK